MTHDHMVQRKSILPQYSHVAALDTVSPDLAIIIDILGPAVFDVFDDDTIAYLMGIVIQPSEEHALIAWENTRLFHHDAYKKHSS